MSGTEEIADWMRECGTNLEQQGALGGYVLEHFNGSGAATPLDVITSKSPDFADADKCAARFASIAERHARGIAGGGIQQFQAGAIYGTETKPRRFLPFTRASLTHDMTAAGFASSPPTPVGILQTGTQWGQAAITAAAQKDALILNLLGGLLKEERQRGIDIMKENREVMGLLRGFIADSMDQRVAIMKEARTSKLMFEGLKLLPVGVNLLSGRELVPEEESAAGLVYDSFPNDAARLAHIKDLEARAPGKGSMLAGLFVKIKKRRAAEARELQDMTGGKVPTMEEAEADVGFDLVDRGLDVVRGKTEGEKTNGTNGATNGHAAPLRAELEIDAAIDRRHTHHLSKADARRFVDGFADILNQQVPAQWAWEGDRMVFKAAGVAKGIVAVIDVDDAEMHIRVALPGLAKLMKSTIEEQIGAALETLDERAKRHAAAAAAANGGQ